jgi:hypothetical protein
VEESLVVVKAKFRIKMKNSLLVLQEKNDYCVCSVLQEIFKSYGISFSQEDIAKNLTPSEDGFLVDDNRIKDFIEGRNLSYEFFWRNQIPLNDPDFILFEMKEHSSFVGIGNHIYLFEDYQNSQVGLRNPEDGKIVSYDVVEMVREMKRLENGCFGLVKKLNM